MWRGLSVAVVLAATPLAVRASVPPTNWRPSSYAGPGLYCGEGFRLQLLDGETATPGFPSEGYTPIVVRSHGGAFGVVVYSFNRPEVVKTLISATPYGDVYQISRTIKESAAGVPKRRSFWFEPKNGGAPFSVDFYAAVPEGWGEFPSSQYRSVVSRIHFSDEPLKDGCLN